MIKKKVLFIVVFLMGIFILVDGLFNSPFMKFLMPGNMTIINYEWIFIIGIIFTVSGLILLFSKRYLIFKKHIKMTFLEVIIITILIVSSAGAGGWLYGQYQKMLVVSTEDSQKMNEQLKMLDLMEENNPFYCKKVIIRDDDIGDSGYLPSLKWISDLAKSKDFKVTFAVIPAMLINNSKTIDYLNQMDREYFEFATHGYEHIHFQELPYEQQYSLIENGTKIIQEYLKFRPVTFVPPYCKSNINTTKALRFLGYHSITDMLGYPSYVINFMYDFEYETEYYPPKHHSFEETKANFDNFYNSTDEYYILFLHDWTFLDGEGKLDETKTSRFEMVVDYIKSKNVQFMTIEEAYQWHMDEHIIRTGMINERSYFIDLRECFYNHTIKFNSPLSWEGKVCVTDATTGMSSIFYEDVFKLDMIKEHLYFFEDE